MTNFTRVNSKAWANTKSPMWRRKWRIEHWSCSHSDDLTWEICCVHETRHMNGLIACHHCDPGISIPSQQTQTLTHTKKQDLLARRSPRITLHMHVGSLNCMHNRAHRANDHSAKAALASPSWAESEQPLGKWVSATNSSRGDSTSPHLSLSSVCLSVAYCIAAVHVQSLHQQLTAQSVASPLLSRRQPQSTQPPPSCATPPSS